MFRTGLLIATSLVITPLWAKALPGAPPAKIIPFSETVQGIEVSDPYRWMESEDAAYEPWLKAQADVAKVWLNDLPDRAAIMAGIEARMAAAKGAGAIQERGPHVFIARRDAGAQTYRLVVRDQRTGAERTLFDPATLETPTAKGWSINYWEASPDGRYVYLGVSPGGSEESTMRFIETATGKAVDSDIPAALFNGGGEDRSFYSQWLPDSSGIMYNRLASAAKRDDPNYYLNTRLFLHRIGTPVATDRLIVERGMAGAPEMTEVEGPTIAMQPDSRQAVLALAYGVERAQRMLIAPVADVVSGTAKWRAVGSRADKIESFAIVGDDLYLLRRDASNGRVVKLSGGETDVAKAVEIVPAGPMPIEQIIATADGVYVIGRGATGTAISLIDKNDKIAPVAMPFDGAAYIFSGLSGREGLYVSLENYVTPRKRLRIVGTTATDTGLGVTPPYSTDAYLMETAMVTARDGTKVPLDIVRRKDLARDGKRPVLLEAYGSYGFSVDPYYNPRLFALLDAGAIYAVAHARGGGEFGRDWWQAGKETTKPNTWRDAIDSAEWLNKSGWTSGRRTTLWGTSAGGIMVGRAVTERPDLWGGAIASVGIMNAMRFEFGPNGKTNIAEFGTVGTPAGAKALYEMDAYLHIRDGVQYPPMLITAGANDPRVIAWQPAKFAARMQTASTGGPVVFKTDFDQGHGIGSTRSQIDEATATVASFSLWAAKQAR